MPGQRLLTLLHISDLHIGHIDPVSGDADFSLPLATLFSNYTWFDGILGHHARGLTDLVAFYKTLEPEEPELLVTGDLTRVGGGVEFDNANDFLFYKLDLNPPSGNEVGLCHGKWRPYAIPGNHDHWPGIPSIWGGPDPALTQYFPKPPYVRPDIVLGNGRTLQVAGINTDDEVGSFSGSRLWARGKFQKQLAALAPQLGPKKPEQIRVLLMHHSWHHTGRKLAIHPASRGALEHFLVDHGVQFVLTGHLHETLCQPFQPDPNVPHGVVECRCGTTTQADQVPYSWHTLGGHFPQRKWPANALFVHRLYADGDKTSWVVEAFYRSRSRGFVPPVPPQQWSFAV